MLGSERTQQEGLQTSEERASQFYSHGQERSKGNRMRNNSLALFEGQRVPNVIRPMFHEVRHLKTIHARYYQHLRRSIGIKASYYSRVSNNQVRIQAGKPTVPSQQLTSSQLRQLANILTRPTSDPRYHVVFSPGCKDRVKFAKGTKTGHPQRYWLELITETALPVLKEYAE